MSTHTLTVAILLAILLAIIGPAVDMMEGNGAEMFNTTTTTIEEK